MTAVLFRLCFFIMVLWLAVGVVVMGFVGFFFPVVVVVVAAGFDGFPVLWVFFFSGGGGDGGWQMLWAAEKKIKKNKRFKNIKNKIR